MTTSDRLSVTDGWIRETYEVYADGQRTIAMIADPENEHAWIKSDLVQSIVQ